MMSKDQIELSENYLSTILQELMTDSVFAADVPEKHRYSMDI